MHQRSCGERRNVACVHAKQVYKSENRKHLDLEMSVDVYMTVNTRQTQKQPVKLQTWLF